LISKCGDALRKMSGNTCAKEVPCWLKADLSSTLGTTSKQIKSVATCWWLGRQFSFWDRLATVPKKHLRLNAIVVQQQRNHLRNRTSTARRPKKTTFRFKYFRGVLC